jgi:hypothetical protein
MPDPTVRAMLLERVDELTACMATLLDEVRAVTEQLEPERARACRNAIILVRTGVDEIRLGAHSRPLDEPEPSGASTSGGCLGSYGRARTVPRIPVLPGDRFAPVPWRAPRVRVGHRADGPPGRRGRTPAGRRASAPC